MLYFTIFHQIITALHYVFVSGEVGVRLQSWADVGVSKRLTLFLQPCRSSRESLVSNPPVAASKLSSIHTYTPLGGMMPNANANPSII